jgi:hypothetical protein
LRSSGRCRLVVLAAVFAFGGVLLIVGGVEGREVLVDGRVLLGLRPTL